MPTAVKSWKFLVEKDGKIVSDYSAHKALSCRTVWEVGEWKHQDGVIRPCYKGFHHSNNPFDALSYVGGSVLARVEVKGTRVCEDDDDFNHKEAVSDMRIVKAGAWGKNDSIGLALHVAQFAASWLKDTSRQSRVRATSEELKIINAGLVAVRTYLHNGTKVPMGIGSDLSSATWSTRYTETSNVMDATYQAVSSCGINVEPSYASALVTYGVSNATAAIDRGNHRVGTVKAAANEWMEHRFKTLPRF